MSELQGSEIFQRIQKTLDENPVVLYMKGTRDMPQCGFSGVVVQILDKLQVPFKDVDVLADPELRQGIKEFANWPTIPQIYIRGEFVGGCDIAREMYASGELEALLKERKVL